jgi:hypothetical protein
LLELELRHAIVEIEDGDAGLAAEANREGTDLQLGAGAGIGPDAVTGDQRPIRRREHPFVFARG